LWQVRKKSACKRKDWGSKDPRGGSVADKGVRRNFRCLRAEIPAQPGRHAEAKVLWDSTKAGVTFTFCKFCPPVIADGRLYVATYEKRVDVYELHP
jgi:hypothetical protein